MAYSNIYDMNNNSNVPRNRNSFPMAINMGSPHPPHHMGSPHNGEAHLSNWFSTSMDSTSSFGQSPVFGSRDLLVTPSSSTGMLYGNSHNNGGEDGEQGEDERYNNNNSQEVFEKRRKRRESHNAVERRRRDNINDRIVELSTLLPDHLTDSVPASTNIMSVSTGQNGSKPINKGTVLKLSVDHIKELKEKVTSYTNKIKELEDMIEQAKRGGNPNVGQQQQNNLYNSHSHHHQQQQQYDPARPSKHERGGSTQFQQQFGELHINNGEEQH